MKTLELLTKARELISTPERWYQGGFGCDAEGRTVSAGAVAEGAACKWCSYGAIITAGQNTGSLEALSALEAVIRDGNNDVAVGPWNDAPERTHAEVLAAFDRAIAACDLNGPGGAGTELT